MWLRSEKRSNRIVRGDASKTSVNLRKIIKSTPNIKQTLKGKCKATTTTTLSPSRNQFQSAAEAKSPTKCNKVKANVKRLVRKAATSSARKCDKVKTRKSPTVLIGRNLRRKLSDSGKENCWQDTSQEDITLYTTDVNVKVQTADVEINRNCGSIDGLANDEALNNFGPIVVDGSADGNDDSSGSDSPNSSCKGACATCRTISAALCQIDKENNTRKFECTNFMKCISECDSTTDYDKMDIADATPSTSAGLALSYYGKPLQELVVPEVDSTTDLFSPVSTTQAGSVAAAEDDQSGRKELPKLTILPSGQTPLYQPFGASEIAHCSKSGMTPTSSGTNNNTSTGSTSNYPSTPDLISLFDEEINKGSTDLCQYTDFFPYNSVIQQALLSCNEVNALCEQTDLASNLQPSDITFLSSMNQTAIDNLKALTNLQNHTSNFLSGITLPKANGVDGRGCGSMTTDNLIHSASHSAMSMYPQQMLMHPQDSSMMHHQQHELVEDGGDIQLETDECMENEEIHERQEELAWDTFDPYVFIKHLPPLTPEMRAKCPALPLKTRSSPEFNLVLDLDETLVHCSLQELPDASFKFPVLFQVNILFLLENLYV